MISKISQIEGSTGYVMETKMRDILNRSYNDVEDSEIELEEIQSPLPSIQGMVHESASDRVRESNTLETNYGEMENGGMTL